MSDLAEQRRASEKPLYIAWMVLLVLGFTIVQFGIVAGIYLSKFGVPTLAQFTTMKVPVYAQSTWWDDCIVYPVMTAGGGAPFSGSNLHSFDPETGESHQFDVTVPIPRTGMVAIDDTLWAVSPTMVVRVKDDRSTEFTPKHPLSKPSPPFSYEEQPAVLDWVASDHVILRLFNGVDWIDHGRIEFPSFLSRTVDGSNQLVANSVNEAANAAHAGRFAALDIRVITDGDRYHLFVTDGSNIAYRSGLEFVQQASALAPENVPQSTILEGWEDVCQTSVSAMTRKSSWSAGLVKGEPIVLTAASNSATPFGNSTIKVHQRSEGKWSEASHVTTPALMDLLAFTDGEQTYVAGQPPVPSLRFYKIEGHELRETGTFLKAPSAGSQEGFEYLGRAQQWIYWPLMIAFALAVSWLMGIYTTAEYQFGVETVELASYTRRMVARLIDHAFLMVPSYFIVHAFGFATRENVEANMDRMFDFGPDSMLVRYIWMMSSMLALSVFLLILNSGLQARWGITFGKWICGIRTKRATLRPCGFFRAMLREILLVVDTFFGMTAIPATLAVAFTNGRQRIGDLAADTVVIRYRRTQLNDGGTTDGPRP